MIYSNMQSIKNSINKITIMNRTIFAIVLIALSMGAYSQSNPVGNGYYEMILPKNYDKVKIEKECIEKAQLAAMEKAFGKVMTQSTNSSQQATNTSATASFSSSSVSFVSGRWVKDLAQPEIEYFKHES